MYMAGDISTSGSDAKDRVFEIAADLFSLLSTPIRLRLVCQLCKGEKSVGELLSGLDVGQPTVSRHLGLLYRGGLLARRKSGAQVYYRLASERHQFLCDAVCPGRQRAAGTTEPPATEGACDTERRLDGF